MDGSQTRRGGEKGKFIFKYGDEVLTLLQIKKFRARKDLFIISMDLENVCLTVLDTKGGNGVPENRGTGNS